MSPTPERRPRLLIALGGNALIRKGQQGSVEEQFANLRGPLSALARLSVDNDIIITHGNGPQVGDLLLMHENCSEVTRLPLEILVAQTQGWLGYMIESTLDEALMELDSFHQKYLVSLISYVVVAKDDPAFAKPSKPVGPVLSLDQAAKATYPTVKTAKGLRRVVASPQPVTIVEKKEIKKLIEMGFIVICCGGGGIPVVREGRSFAGVNAVIDKDLASARLAREVGVDTFIIATDVQGVMADFNSPEEKLIPNLNPGQAAGMLGNSSLPSGSMGPKVEAASRFAAANPGHRAIICHIDEIEAAVGGEAGTVIKK